MIERPLWTERIRDVWSRVPIVWLSGVRRSGKTTIAKSIDPEQALYLNCDRPAVGEMVRDPVLFYRDCRKPIVIFDEIHQLSDPCRVLKIGADEFPHLRILATGSSTLAASRKFKDTLAGRKRQIQLLPVLWDEQQAFGVSLQKRLYHGGLPPTLLSVDKDPGFYREWMDSFFSRDIQNAFGFRDAAKFNALFEYLMRQSGGLLEVARTASAMGVSRPTVESHLNALEVTHAVRLVRPFFGGGQKEIVKMPKCYAFDTGFVSFCRGWDPLRQEDYGSLWEHWVLETLISRHPDQSIQYWRDKSGHELDFVVAAGRDCVDVYECKWDPAALDPAALRVFRSFYPHGDNYLVSPITVPAYKRRIRELVITVCNPSGMAEPAR